MKMLPARPARALSAAAAVAALAVPVMGTSTAGAAQAPLPCRASVNNAHPADYTTVRVRVRTAAKAAVTAVAHYKTVNHKETGAAGRRGRLTIPYYISGATPGYTVQVDVTVTAGSRTGNCSTSFTPQAG